MKTVAEFAGMKFREVGDQDRERLEQWINADPEHRMTMSPETFLGEMPDGEKDPRPTCLALEDEKGTVFYVRISRAARVTIQFAPNQTRGERLRNGTALTEGMALLESILERAGAEEWIFNTRNPRLKELAMSRMGFTESPRELVRSIVPAVQDSIEEVTMQPQQLDAQEGA